MIKLKNKKQITWGGYKNTTIPKMLREVFDPQGGSRTGRGGGGGSRAAADLHSAIRTTLPKKTFRERRHNYTRKDPETTYLPATVTFKNKSTGEDLSYKWDFGDGHTSTSKNPIHKYTKVGTFIVTLTATNIGGSDKKVVTNAITTRSTGASTATDQPPSDKPAGWNTGFELDKATQRVGFDSTAGGRLGVEGETPY